MYETGELKYEKVYGDYKEFFLPHSCDEWIIGNIEDAKVLYKELGELIAKAQQEK